MGKMVTLCRKKKTKTAGKKKEDFTGEGSDARKREFWLKMSVSAFFKMEHRRNRNGRKEGRLPKKVQGEWSKTRRKGRKNSLEKKEEQLTEKKKTQKISRESGKKIFKNKARNRYNYLW